MVWGPASPRPDSRGGCIHMNCSDDVIPDDGPLIPICAKRTNILSISNRKMKL
jgi:hypothetical protein